MCQLLGRFLSVRTLSYDLLETKRAAAEQSVERAAI